jgi:hypothetical protein
MRKQCVGLAAVLLLASWAFGQESNNTPRVTGVEPSAGKVGQNLTVRGDHLGKESVLAVYLSDNDKDYKGTLVEQTDQKIVFQIPDVKAGDYNVSIKVGNNIFIQPVRCKVGG